MKAARSGFRKPALASATPTVSTAIVPAKFCQMMRRVCLAIARAEAELERLVDLIEAYEAKRWPSGKVADGKG